MARRRRFDWKGLEVVADEDWVSEDEALRALGDGYAKYLLFAGMRGLIQPVRNGDGAQGVSRASLERELEWRRNATYWDRVKRWLGLLEP